MLWKIRKRKKDKTRQRVIIAAGVLLAYTLIGFFGLPPIIKSQLEKRASAALGRAVTVGEVRFNPYAASLTLERLDVRLKDGPGSFLGWDRLYVNLEPIGSLFGSWKMGAVELDGFHVAAVLKKDGSFNFTDIIDRLNATAAPASAGPAKPARPLRIGSLKVQGARVDFSDETHPRLFATTIGPVSFGLTEFHTAVAQGAPYHFEAITEVGEKLTWTGTLSAAPVASAGELKLEGILLSKYAPYYAEHMRAEVTEGKLSVQGRYEINLTEGQRVMKLQDGMIQLRGLKLLEPATKAAVVDLPSLDVTGINADALTLKATVNTVALTGGQLQVRREKDGSINLLNLLQPTAAAAPAVTAPASAPPAPVAGPDFLIAEVKAQGLALQFNDLAAPRPAQLGFTDLQLSLKQVTLADGAVMPVNLALNWAPQGTVKVAGTVSIRPDLKADLQADAATLSLLPLSPYLEEFVNARITKGSVTTSGAVHLATVAGSPAVAFEGGVTLDQLALVDGQKNEELAGFATLALNGLKVAAGQEIAVSLDAVDVKAPFARMLMSKDGTLNLSTLAKTTTAPAAAPLVVPGSAAAATPGPKITIAKVVIENGDFTFADHSVEPTVRMGINQFGGTIAGLSSENTARAEVDLKAMVNGAGPVAITGQLDPLGARKFIDLKVDCKNVDLLPLSAYSGKYAGYALARGQLNLDVKAKLDDKKLDANNVITLNQFTFGAPVESPDATKLPVRLGVALLKDMNGQIVIDVPMEGNIDDPSLRIGKVVVRVIVNILTKAAVSPFALLGSMFGGGGDELAFQQFVPGQSALQESESAKLATMVKALTNRPGLSLGIEGSYDVLADTQALKEQKFADAVRKTIWEERHAVDPNIAPPDQLVISPEAHAVMVKKLFDQVFPPGTPQGAPLPSKPVASVSAPEPVSEPSPAAKKTLLDRLLTLFGLLGERSKPAPAPAPAPEAVAPVALPMAPVEATEVAMPTLEEMTGKLIAAVKLTDDDLRALAEARAQRVRDYFLNEGKIAADRLFLSTGDTAAKENKGARVFLTLQ